MSEGLKTTFKVLAETANEAAVGVLIPALDSPYQQVRDESLRTILMRRSPTGGREVVRRLHAAPDHWHEILAEYRGRMSPALRDAVLGTDEQMCTNGCRAILEFGEYDLMPALINAAEDATNPNAQRAADTLLELAEMFYQELATTRDYRNRRDPQLVRRNLQSSLELSIKRFGQHRRVEIVEAFVLLANHDNSTLKQILRDPHEPAYLSVVEVLKHSPRAGAMRLLLSYLEDRQAPSSAITILAHRSDPAFLRHLLRKVGYEPSAAAAHNLKRIESIAWLRDDLSILDTLDDSAQHGAVQMFVASGMKRLEVFRVIEYLLRHGKPGGRRAAAAALEAFSGAQANALVMEAIDDADPRVQAHALVQLRQRSIPGAMSRLLERAQSKHEVVRQAVRESLKEFRFERYLSTFDLLDPEVRESTGALVKRIDPETIPGLAAEMAAASRGRRLRAIEVTLAIDVVRELEQPLVHLLSDADHVVRAEAARALAQWDSPAVRQALTAGLSDRSVAVQHAARASLEQFAGPPAEPNTADGREAR